jgi:hypothetical protein
MSRYMWYETQVNLKLLYASKVKVFIKVLVKFA